MIGSRETPADICCLARLVATQMALDGRVGRSGNAKGMDEQLTLGILEASRMRADGRILGEVYLPEPDFRDWLFKKIPNYHENFIFTPMDAEIMIRARELAKSVHPNWNGVLHAKSDFGLKAHSRNPFQIMGRDLETPSDYVILFAEPTNKGKAVKGGTNTAFQLALSKEIRTYNLWHEKTQNKVLDYLGITRDTWYALCGK